MFNRGKHAGMCGSEVEELIGDRDAGVGEGLAALEGDRTRDVVIDNSGYVPRHVLDSARLLKGRVGRSLYISSVAVYDTATTTHLTEDGPLEPAPVPATEDVTWEPVEHGWSMDFGVP